MHWWSRRIQPSAGARKDKAKVSLHICFSKSKNYENICVLIQDISCNRVKHRFPSSQLCDRHFTLILKLQYDKPPHGLLSETCEFGQMDMVNMWWYNVKWFFISFASEVLTVEVDHCFFCNQRVPPQCISRQIYVFLGRFILGLWLNGMANFFLLFFLSIVL